MFNKKAEIKNSQEENLPKKNKEEIKPKEIEQKFSEFKIEQNENVDKKKNEKKISKTSKIKKVDFDFDFDSFNDINFSNFEGKENSGENSEQKKEDQDPFACFDEKAENNKIEEENYNQNSGGYFSEKSSVDIEKIREEADKKFANKKAISSEDYMNL